MDALDAKEAKILRLNPFLTHDPEEQPPMPTGQPGEFIWGVRYYAGMLERGDDLSHSVGHIEQLCKDASQRVRTCRYCGHSPATYSEGQCRQCGEPSK